MTKVMIIGGGLTGVLAAFEAHRLGCRDIELHDRFDRLGGVARVRRAHGSELREGTVYFGPRGDAVRTGLERQGVAFLDFDNRFGSVSLDDAGAPVWTLDFGGPALHCANPALTPPPDERLSSRLEAYPLSVTHALKAYVEWHLGTPSEVLHDGAATPLAINRIYPLKSDLAGLAELKASSPLHDELLGIPRGLWGRTANATASLPRAGFDGLFETCAARLKALGVNVFLNSLVSPREALAEMDAVVVWAASPTPLFKAAELPTPALVRKAFTSVVFRARYDGPLPFYLQNFTARGTVFRAYVYESGGRTLLTAECVSQPEPGALRREVGALMAGFPGRLELGEQLAAASAQRWIYHSVETIQALAGLRARLADRLAGRFIAGAWEVYGKSHKLAEVNAALASALDADAKGSGRIALAC